MARKRTEITIETERTIYISSRSESSMLRCEVCARRVPMLTVEEAAAVARARVDEILQKIEDGQLHYVRLRGGRLRICPNSLLK